MLHIHFFFNSYTFRPYRICSGNQGSTNLRPCSTEIVFYPELTNVIKHTPNNHFRRGTTSRFITQLRNVGCPLNSEHLNIRIRMIRAVVVVNQGRHADRTGPDLPTEWRRCLSHDVKTVAGTTEKHYTKLVTHYLIWILIRYRPF